MSRFSSSLLIPLAGLTILASAILIGGRKATDPRGRPTIVWAHPPCPPDLMRVYEEAFREFRESHPDIDFQVLHITGNYQDKIKVMFAGNVAPDVIFAYPTEVAAWVDLGALRPLNDLLATNGKTKAADYFPAALKTFSFRGNVYGLPKDASADILFYNPELFRRHGLKFPTADSTWPDLLEAAKRITEDSNGDGRVDVYGMEQPTWLLLLYQNGVPIISDDGTQCLLDSPAAVAALEFWVALRQEYQVVPTPESMMDLSMWRMFALQRVGMFVSRYPAVQILRRTCDFEWDIAPLPRQSKPPCVPNVGSALAVTTQSRHPEAAFEWARWMTSEGMRQVMGFELPSYIPIAGSAEWGNQPLRPASKHVAVDSMRVAGPPLQHPAYAEILDAITPSLDRANRGKISVREAVKAVVPKVNAILARYPQTGGAE